MLRPPGTIGGMTPSNGRQAVAIEPVFADAILTRVAFWGLFGENDFGPMQRAGFSLDNLVFDVQGEHVAYTMLKVPEPTTLALWLVTCCALSIGNTRRLR